MESNSTHGFGVFRGSSALWIVLAVITALLLFSVCANILWCVQKRFTDKGKKFLPQFRRSVSLKNREMEENPIYGNITYTHTHSDDKQEVETPAEVYVLKRPHVDKFLQRMGEMFECVLFTASLAKYADPVTDLLDQCGVFRARLFRESCVFHHGCYVKDLSRLGRQLNKTLILDNSPASYIFHPENAVPVMSWFDDVEDTELLNLLPVFEELSGADDVYAKLRQLREP
ncbi:hypothetical protein PDJAM_G00260180 [Pangasius djambal]|nr:hypothetical protein [Pangasius djambal]